MSKRRAAETHRRLNGRCGAAKHYTRKRCTDILARFASAVWEWQMSRPSFMAMMMEADRNRPRA